MLLIFSYNQFYLIYNDINVKFQRNVFVFISITNINFFLIQLNFKKKIW